METPISHAPFSKLARGANQHAKVLDQLAEIGVNGFLGEALDEGIDLESQASDGYPWGGFFG